MGSYTYGDSAHLHAATSVSLGASHYTASYDAAGDMVCRAPSSATTCAGASPTGQQLTWDVEGRLAAWQNTPTSPTTTAQYLYDGAGQRVVQQVTDTTAGTRCSPALPLASIPAYRPVRTFAPLSLFPHRGIIPITS